MKNYLVGFLERRSRHLTDTDSLDGSFLYELSHVGEDDFDGSLTQSSETIYVQLLIA